MNFDIWFKKQSRIVQFILLIIPVVGWVIEILVRLSIVVKRPAPLNLIVLIVMFIIGVAWLPVFVDAIILLATGDILFGNERR